MNYLLLFISAVTAYLLGTINNAYFLSALFAKKNIMQEGSQNAGALNSYEVTGKRWIGITVMILDIGKGFLAVMSARWTSGDDFYAAGVASIFVILGHNYNLFFGFKGGRGLAASVGSFMAINPLVILFWCIMWVTGWVIIRKNVHIANAIALVASPILLFSTPRIALEITQMFDYNILYFQILYTIICLLIMLRHLKPISELIKIERKS